MCKETARNLPWHCFLTRGYNIPSPPSQWLRGSSYNPWIIGLTPKLNVCVCVFPIVMQSVRNIRITIVPHNIHQPQQIYLLSKQFLYICLFPLLVGLKWKQQRWNGKLLEDKSYLPFQQDDRSVILDMFI